MAANEVPPPPLILPQDAHNLRLVSNVHPDGWRNPEPARLYNLVVLGAGTAGLVTAVGAASLGARVALVEAHLLGGDCLNAGCVPSKALIRAARAVEEIRRAEAFGIRIPGPPEVDFAAVMERMRRVRSEISPHDSAERMKSLGIDLFFGRARFVSPDTIETGGAKLRFRKAVVATGASPVVPDVPGLREAGFHTNETIFTLTERPGRLAVLGAGPLGCELAQAFHRLGSKVVLLHKHPVIMDREVPEASAILLETFLSEGMEVLTDATIHRVETAGGQKLLYYSRPGTPRGIVAADAILVGVGRAPNVAGLGLEAAGIEYDSRSGIRVDDRLRTTNPRVYAAGDVCLRQKFTHTADASARIVLENALFPGRRKLSALTVPHVTYTDPEVASVGMSEREAAEAGIPVEALTVSMAEIDRARLDGEEAGFARVLFRRGTDRMVGATIVSRHAGETIGELTLAITAGLGLGTLSRMIHPYPTQAEVVKGIGDIFNRRRLTPFLRRLFSHWFAAQRCPFPARAAEAARRFRDAFSAARGGITKSPDR